MLLTGIKVSSTTVLCNSAQCIFSSQSSTEDRYSITVRIQLLHLSGPYRGRTITYHKDKILIGTIEDADIHFPEGFNVVEKHAELSFSEEGCAFYLKAIDGDVFVNRQQITEIILAQDDLIEIGIDGPKARFRIRVGDNPVCKPIRQMMRDAREVHSVSGIKASTRVVHQDMIADADWKRRISIPIFAMLVALVAAYAGVSIGSMRTARQHEILRKQQAENFQNALTRIQAEMETFRREHAGKVSREEVDQLKSDLARRTKVVDSLVARNAALKKVLEVYSRGVCLIYGIYTFKAKQENEWVSVIGPYGEPLELEYMGSGFLADNNGYIVTNRHVAQPWWNNETVEPLLAQDMKPEFLKLIAVFPGQAPVPIDLASIRLSDDVDVAVFRVEVQDVPVLPIYTGSIAAVRGERVILLGYPTGLNAMLARAETDLVEEVLSTATDTTSLIAELSKHGAVTPVITNGILNEVLPRRLVYDAETTSGGSGGPVFGPDGTVIGVNFAITRDFDGSNFGVPISFAVKLLEKRDP